MPLSREVDENGLVSYRASARRDAQSTPSFRYYPSSAGGITYSKTALWLNTLERWLGWTPMQRIMPAHFATCKFRHPNPQASFATLTATPRRPQPSHFGLLHL